MTKQTLKELHQKFINEQRYIAKLREETLRGYEACFRTFNKVIGESVELPEDLSSGVMVEFFKRLQKRERIVGKGILKTGIKESTVATYRNKLNKFFQWLIVREYLEKDLFKGIPYPKVEYTDRKFLKRDEIKQILATLSFGVVWANELVKKRNIAMYNVLLYCGLRKGELIGLEVTDIDLERRELRVRASTSKSKCDRYVALNKRVCEVLKDYLDTRRRLKCHHIPSLWVSSIGSRGLSMNGFKHLNKKVVRESGIRFHPHQFRHTYAVNLLSSGADIYKVKTLLGHSDIRMTTVYLRCIPSKVLQQDVERLDVDSFVR